MTMTFFQLFGLSWYKSLRSWWLARAEQHYLICADTERARAREANMNAAYYQKKAAMARSERIRT